MTGPMLNAAGILLGGSLGLVKRKGFTAAQESFFKVGIGVFAVFYGLRLTWQSLSGPVGHWLTGLLVAVLALMLGKLTGHFARLQELSNGIGRAARERISAAAAPPAAAKGGQTGLAENPSRAELAFKTCGALFSAAPLGILGAVQDGLSDYYQPLAVKAVMDGLAAFGFARIFGPGVLLAAIPVFALQGTISLLCARFLKLFLDSHHLTNPVNATGGLLVFAVGLVVLELKKIQLAAYLPSLVFAGLLAWVLLPGG